MIIYSTLLFVILQLVSLDTQAQNPSLQVITSDVVVVNDTIKMIQCIVGSWNIQDVSLYQMEDNNVTITCYFIEGSSIQGCHYRFVRNDISCNTSGVIMRGSGSYGSARIQATEIVDCTELIVFELNDEFSNYRSYIYNVSSLLQSGRRNTACLSSKVLLV